MHIRNRTASLAFKLFIALAGTIALLYATGLFTGGSNTTFPCYFTNISNIAVAAYFWCATIMIITGKADGSEPWAPKLKYALTLAITVTWLVAHFMLNGGLVFQGGVFNPEMLVLHYIVPICTIADWLLFDSKGHMGIYDPLLWPLFPLVYLVYLCVLVCGFGISSSVDGRWPYPFIDFDALGVPMVLINVIILVVAFVMLGLVYVLIDKQMAKHAKNP
jgi:hypothetical protein